MVSVWERVGISLQDPRTIGLSALEHYFICPDDQCEAYLNRALDHLDALSFPVERSLVLHAYASFVRRRYLDSAQDLTYSKAALSLLVDQDVLKCGQLSLRHSLEWQMRWMS